MARKFFCGLLLFIAAAAFADSVPMLFYGEASWYGEQFHGRRTANGEIYDMNKLTAAHRTLPFGTLVEVTNLENDRKVTVVINDRGPFARGRILDLSKEGASQLGFIEQGIAKVEVRVLTVGRPGVSTNPAAPVSPAADPAADPVDTAPAASDLSDFPAIGVNPTPRVVSPELSGPQGTGTGRFAVQIGAFSRNTNADDLAAKLNREGYAAYVLPPVGAGLYRVLVGPYSGRAIADQIKEKLAASYPDAFIRNAE
jgi:rare lipoprotein A